MFPTPSPLKIKKVRRKVRVWNNDKNNNTSNNNNNNNNNNPSNPYSGQHALALIGWFERAVILCGGTKAQKQQSHRSSFKFKLLDWRTGYLNWSSVRCRTLQLQGKSHVKQVLCANPWPCPTNEIVYARLWIHNDARFHINVKVIPLFFHGKCAHFGIIWHLGLKNLLASPWATSIHNNIYNNDENVI